MNIDSKTLKELKKLQAQVAKAISSFDARRKQDTLAEIEEIARAKGFSLAELTGGPKTRKRTVSAPKYANPADKSDTWTGRGRKPAWFVAALSSGRKPEQLAI